MLGLSMSVLAFAVCLVIVPAFMLGIGFAAAIPLYGLALMGKLWSKGREKPLDIDLLSKGPTRGESLSDWHKRQKSTEQEIWRHAG